MTFFLFILTYTHIYLDLINTDEKRLRKNGARPNKEKTQKCDKLICISVTAFFYSFSYRIRTFIHVNNLTCVCVCLFCTGVFLLPSPFILVMHFSWFFCDTFHSSSYENVCIMKTDKLSF